MYSRSWIVHDLKPMSLYHKLPTHDEKNHAIAMDNQKIDWSEWEYVPGV